MTSSFDLEYESDKMKCYEVFFNRYFWVSSWQPTDKHSLQITWRSVGYFACAQFCNLIWVEQRFVRIALQTSIISVHFNFWIST